MSKRPQLAMFAEPIPQRLTAPFSATSASRSSRESSWHRADRFRHEKEPWASSQRALLLKIAILAKKKKLKKSGKKISKIQRQVKEKQKTQLKKQSTRSKTNSTKIEKKKAQKKTEQTSQKTKLKKNNISFVLFEKNVEII